MTWSHRGGSNTWNDNVCLSCNHPSEAICFLALMLLHYVKPDFVACDLSICSLLHFNGLIIVLSRPSRTHVRPPTTVTRMSWRNQYISCLTNFWDVSLPLFFDLPFPTYTCKFHVSDFPTFLPTAMGNKHICVTWFHCECSHLQVMWRLWNIFCKNQQIQIAAIHKVTSRLLWRYPIWTHGFFFVSGWVFLPCLVLEGGKWKVQFFFLKVGLVCLFVA